MKWLIHGDPHLKVNNIQMARQFFDWLLATAEEQEVDGIINLGDLFDTHAVVRSEVMGEYIRFLDIRRNKLIYIHLLGNHEFFRPKDSTYHALQALKMRDDDTYHVVDEVTKLYGFGFVPYMPNADDFPQLDMEHQIVFAHQTFLGADFGKFRPEEGVPPEKIKNQVLVYSGHIHTRQQVGDVKYVGSPISYGVNDVDQVKGIIIFDDETLDEKFIQSPFPMWRSLSIDIREPGAAKTLVTSINSNDNWVVDVIGPRLEVAEFIDSELVLGLKKKVKIRFRSKPVDVAKEKVSIKAVSITGMVDEYIDKIYAGSIDKDVLKNSMRELFDGK